MKLGNIHWKSSGFICVAVLVIFAAVSAGVLGSAYYMNLAITEEENAQSKRAEYRQLGQNLAKGSDYLTEEVRNFAVTGDIVHLWNYWQEIYVTRQRDNAIAVFEQSNAPGEEQELLKTAKKFSDLLVATETRSMKMVLLSMGVTADKYQGDGTLAGYVKSVMEYDLINGWEELNQADMRQKAIDILYDENYESYKTLIMSPIDEFQEVMNQRLDSEVEERKSKTRFATVILIVSAIVSLGAIAFLIILMNRLYILPLKSYTSQLRDAGLAENRELEDVGNLKILNAKIMPYGAQELIQFAHAYNRVIDMFFSELCKRKNVEESMRKARNEAELANQAKGIFLAQMSHELRTPLNAVSGYTYLLERTELDGQQRDYVDNIRSSAKGLLELINQILDYTKIDTGHLELETVTFSIPKLAEEVRRILWQQAKEKGLYLRLHVERDVPEKVEGDPLRLRQVLMNLIGNALKFTETGGVDIIIGRGDSGQENRYLLEFEVRDSGIGISSEAMERIFQPFTQSDASVTRKYGGTGLGLPICSQIISRLGDGTHTLEVKSQEGIGSVFYFRMDYGEGGEEPEEPEQGTPGLPDCQGKKVLLTDDNMINIRVQGEILKLCGMEVLTAESGRETLQILEERKDIDILLMDIRMPEMDGYETGRRLRRIKGYERTPVIALTADAVGEVRRKAKEAGMNDCLLKPLEQEELFALLRHYLGEAAVQKIPEEAVQKATGETTCATSGDAPATTIFFSYERCLRRLGGRESTIYTLLETFLELHSGDEEKLSRLLEGNNWEEAGELMHGLKGVCSNLCCDAMAELCRTLQKELESGKGSPKDIQQRFCGLWGRTLEQIESAFAQLKIAQVHRGTDMEAEKPLSQEALAGLLARIARLCEEYDTEAVELVEKHGSRLAEYLGPEQLEALHRSCLRYDFQGMSTCLRTASAGQRPSDGGRGRNTYVQGNAGGR